MPVFVHEFFCSGGFDGDLRDSSLAREGLAMLAAVVEDFARCEDCSVRVATTLDARLRGAPIAAPSLNELKSPGSNRPPQSDVCSSELAGAAEATLVIAPESNGRLLERRRMIDAAGGRFLGHSADAIRLCGDKLTFCAHLTRHSVPTLSTSPWDFSAKPIDFPFPIVLKPRDGAGSDNTFLIRDRDELEARRDSLAARFAELGHEPIVQPFLSRISIAVARRGTGLIGAEPNGIEILPLAEQRLSRDGRFHYLGGRIPAPEIPTEIAYEAAQRVIRRRADRSPDWPVTSVST